MAKNSFPLDDLISSKQVHWLDKVPSCMKGLLLAVLFAYGLELLDFLLGNRLDSLGVEPRSLSGLIGIPLMPFLHGGFAHLFSNTLPFLVLGWIVLQAEKEDFIVATTVIILLGGLGTWAIGRSGSVNIGASGLVYGYFGYVMTRAILEKKLGWIIVGLVVGVFFWGMIFGVIPQFGLNQVSWEGHLCGMLAGAWFGWNRTKEDRL